MKSVKNLNSQELMKSVIQRIATGPELSKNISREEAKQTMLDILNDEIDPVQAAIFLIALRMKRETMDENLGVHDAIIETTHSINIAADNLINIADPYDGFSRNLPSSIFLLPVPKVFDIEAVGAADRKLANKANIEETERHALSTDLLGSSGSDLVISQLELVGASSGGCVEVQGPGGALVIGEGCNIVNAFTRQGSDRSAICAGILCKNAGRLRSAGSGGVRGCTGWGVHVLGGGAAPSWL